MDTRSLFQKSNKILFYWLSFISLIITICVGIFLKIFNIISFDTFVNWVTGFSTLFTAVIVLFTLFEMKEQRVSTYKPVIVVKDSRINVTWDNDNQDPLKFSINNNSEISSGKTKKKISSELESYNIGLGAAQKISISYTFDLQAIIDNIKKLDKESQIRIKDSDSLLSIKSKVVRKCYPHHKYDDINIDYILPANIDSKPTFIQLPSKFIDFFLVYLFFLLNSLNEESAPLEQIAAFNKCNMILKYQDIGNEQYSKEYVVEFDIFGIVGDAQHNVTELIISVNLHEIDR